MGKEILKAKGPIFAGLLSSVSDNNDSKIEKKGDVKVGAGFFSITSV
jgi:hypothetical protein